jgi:hypothetical protein
MLVELAPIDTEGVTLGATVIVTVLPEADAGEAQAAFEVITTVTWSLLARVELLYEAELVPTLPPFSFHWYEGEAPPFVGVAVNVTSVPAHTEDAEAPTTTAGVTALLIVIVTAFEVAVATDAQAAFEVSTQVTTSLLAKVVDAYVVLLVPTLLPFTFHWYEGVAPPLVGVAVNVTLAPAHTDVADALMLTEGATTGFTVMFSVFEVAAVGEAQAAFDVSTTLTALPLTSDEVVNVLLLVPALVEPIFHWYEGLEPPLAGVAVNVTEAPAQPVVVAVAMLTEGAATAVTVIVTPFDVAVVGVAHAAFEVSTQVITSLLANVVDENEAELVPTLLPFTFHW